MRRPLSFPYRVEQRDVRRLSKSDGRFVLELNGRTITANEVVVATGPFQTAYVPKIAESLEPGV